MMKKFFVLLSVFILINLLSAAEFTGFSDSIPENALQIIQIDSGVTVADIYFIRLPDRRFIVVDTGEFKTAESVLIPALNKFEIKEIDVLILTHFHSDHVGGTFSLLNDPEIRVKKIMYSSMPPEQIPGKFTKKLYARIMNMADRKNIPVQKMEVGDTIDFGNNVTAVVVGAAESGSKNKDLNGHSLVFRLKYKDFTALFTGDCSIQQETRIFAGGHTLKSDLLKVGHHAGANSTSNRFLEVVSPKAAIACMPAWLSQDPKGKRVEKMLRNRKIPFFRSWEFPNAIIFSDGKTFGIKK